MTQTLVFSVCRDRRAPLLAAALAAATLLTPAPAAAQATEPDSMPRICPAPTGMVGAEVRRPPVPVPATAPASADIDISSDNARLGVSGDATLSGNVKVTQGDRELRADNVEYDAKTNSFRVSGSMEYRDPLVRARGARPSVA